MLKYGMPDLRDMFDADTRWLAHYGFSAFEAPNPATGLSMSPETWNGLEVHRFGDGPELADELLHLVLEGKKTATCWDAAEGLKGAEVGKPWAVKNSAGRACAASSRPSS